MIENCTNHRELLCEMPDAIRGRMDMRGPNEKKFILTAAVLDLSLEHYKSISVLVGCTLFASASALVRCQFECYVRALWMLSTATEQELQAIESDEPLMSRKSSKKGRYPRKRFSEYVTEIRDPQPNLCEMIRRDFDELWPALNSYTHGGALPMLRRVDQNQISSKHNNDDIEQLSAIANEYAVYAMNLAARVCQDQTITHTADEFAHALGVINRLARSDSRLRES